MSDGAGFRVRDAREMRMAAEPAIARAAVAAEDERAAAEAVVPVAGDRYRVGRHGRRVVGPAQCIEHGQRESEIAIGPGRIQRTRPDRGLRKLADETGGGYFELKKTTELAPTFTRVAAELHSLYTIGFTPTVFDNKEHKLEVKMKQQGQTARARRSYTASQDRLSGTK